MIKCPHCGNKNKKELVLHDGNLVELGVYGRFFTCLKCKKGFCISERKANSDEVMGWPDV